MGMFSFGKSQTYALKILQILILVHKVLLLSFECCLEWLDDISFKILFLLEVSNLDCNMRVRFKLQLKDLHLEEQLVFQFELS